MWKIVKRRDLVWLSVLTLTMILLTYTQMPIPFERLKNTASSSLRISIFDFIREDRNSSNGFLLNEDMAFDYLDRKFNSENGDKVLALPWWEENNCMCDTTNCTHHIAYMKNVSLSKQYRNISICGIRASMDGDHQRVISLSLYGNDSDYYNGISKLLSKTRALYPGWKVWLYTNPRNKSQVLCPLLNEYKHLRICDVTNLLPPLHNIEQVHPFLWRIAPLGDSSVDVLLSRDSDSMPTMRERVAVNEWLDSGMLLHVMRDHPQHTMPILGGMWGARWDIQQDSENKSSFSNRWTSLRPPPSSTDLRIIRNHILVAAYKHFDYGFDQFLLEWMLWPAMAGFVMSHDSFYCKDFPNGWRPWPTKREKGQFVGSPIYRKKYRNETLDIECPVSCRPPSHPGWIKC